MNINKLISEIAKQPAKLHEISYREFEEVVAELLAGFGWEISLTSKNKDGGYDILGVVEDAPGLHSTWVVECKRYAAKNKVGIDIGRTVYAVKSMLGVSNALIVSTSNFTKDLIHFVASHYDISLINHDDILKWIEAYSERSDHRPYLADKRFYSCFIS